MSILSFFIVFIVVLGVVACMLFFTDYKNPKNYLHKYFIFFLGIVLIVASELNSEFLNISLNTNIMFILLPFILFTLTYLTIYNLNNKNI